jgi:hypothetical protein
VWGGRRRRGRREREEGERKERRARENGEPTIAEDGEVVVVVELLDVDLRVERMLK